jgi:hypothetical protein
MKSLMLLVVGVAVLMSTLTTVEANPTNFPTPTPPTQAPTAAPTPACAAYPGETYEQCMNRHERHENAKFWRGAAVTAIVIGILAWLTQLFWRMWDHHLHHAAAAAALAHQHDAAVQQVQQGTAAGTTASRHSPAYSAVNTGMGANASNGAANSQDLGNMHTIDLRPAS